MSSSPENAANIDQTGTPLQQQTEKLSKTSQLQDRLFQLRMKINQGRKANKDEVEEEYKRMTSKKNYHKEEEEDDDDGTDKHKKSKGGKPIVKDLMNQTAEQASWVAEKNRKKAETAATFGLNAFTDDQYHRAYEKKLKKLPTAKPIVNREEDEGNERTTIASEKESSSFSLVENPLDYGKVNTEVSDAALEKLSKDIIEREQQRKKYGKRRLHVDGDIDYINDQNAKFNRKLDRAFDKYTVEIRQNLERGTAV
jgi:hypothetical protein